MAKVEGIIKIRGSIDGLCFYKMNGAYYVRKKSSVTRKRVKHAAEFKRVRENAQEFGWSVKIGKLLRGYWQPLKPFMDKSLYYRLQGVLYKIMQKGSGLRGERVLDLQSHKLLLTGFEFKVKDGLSGRLLLPLDIQVNTNRNQGSLAFSSINPLYGLNPPKGATHFKIHLSGLGFSTFMYQSNLDAYAPSSQNALGLFDEAQTSILDLKQIHQNVQLQFNLGQNVVLNSHNCLIVSVGVTFYQTINGDFYQLEDGESMQIVDVF